MVDPRPTETMVEFHTGLGTGKKIIWSAYMQHLPRVGDEVVIKGFVYEVSKVRHDPEEEKVSIYVR